ncbi:RsmB/NOP family class I SAM-dependent RNA methyltransferase [Devosia nitrariae]|uniref:MFS transporter n=1 Tax=Devosia nitrariae TaxID=2071872 RepID=A0ABQ5W5V8_9HYPH|nr:RsmB/NOP family class I SAM-dependent RNA methyltransferase [Devosia nitrariae]GLQ55449.1 MFS transporter [Devosia nitrariae]
MRLPGRLSAAIEVLTEVDTRHRPVSEALKTWGIGNRFAGASDRAAIGNLVYDALRRRASHGHVMGSDDPRALVLAVAIRDWGEEPEMLNAAFAEDRHAPEPLTKDEIARLERGDDSLASAGNATRADAPEWLESALERAFSNEWVTQLRAMTGRPSLDLRVNMLKSGRERVMKSLKRFEPMETAIAPHGLRMPAGSRDARTPNVTSDEGYLKGWFEVQDEGSQIVSALVDATVGGQVLDLCAGAGGKTLAMAAAMGNTGQIFAYDTDRTRLAPIYDRLKRNGVRNVQVRAPGEGALDDLAGRMDRVLIDAPCTGTGTWRRRPDTKWKLTPELLAQRTAEQAALLDEAVRLVKPGGTLVYITCSILPQENGDQIAAFRIRHPEFAVRDAATLWGAQLSLPLAAVTDAEGGLILTPLTTGTDGFYFCALQRKS